MNRRFFLECLGYLSLASFLSSCNSASKHQIKVTVLRRSLPIQLLKNAQRSMSPAVPVSISTKNNMAELFGQLQQWQVEEEKKAKQIKEKQNTEKETTLHKEELRLVGLGDYWLSQAIRSQLITPLELSDSTLNSIPGYWKSLIQRDNEGNPSSTGKFWGAPYRWGATLLVYRKDKLKTLDWELKDWSDLWRPELKQKVGLLNQPREVIGMTLKMLGDSYNSENPSQQADLNEKLRSLHQQTRTYSSKEYIQPLILGDTWVAMGWSSDILPALSQDDNLGVIFPKSGSAVWADLWVKSKFPVVQDSADFPEKKFISQWVDYWWSETVSNDISKFTDAASINPLKTDSDNLSQTLLSENNLSQSEFLLPLSHQSIDQYQRLWQAMRAPAINP